MTKHDLDKAYVSPYDRFLYQFDATHAKSESQLKEIAKYQRIALLRDDASFELREEEIWREF